MAQSVHIIFQDIELPDVRGEIKFSNNNRPILTINHLLKLDHRIEAKIRALYNIPVDVYLKVIEVDDISITYQAYRLIEERNQFGDEANRAEPVIVLRRAGGRKRTRKMRKTRRHRKN